MLAQVVIVSQAAGMGKYQCSRVEMGEPALREGREVPGGCLAAKRPSVEQKPQKGKHDLKESDAEDF